MRKISKSAAIPKSLQGVKPPISPETIDNDLYKRKDVKDQLKKDQHQKCAYCECRLNGDYGDVEHFRPKKAYSIHLDNTLITPGYYWLAYEWRNLLLSCTTCNRKFKANHFVLEDETKRDIANKNISQEKPLLVNPADEDPADYIEFHQHIAVPKVIDGAVSAKGKHTIALFELNSRSELVNYRREAWECFEDYLLMRDTAIKLIELGIDAGDKLLDKAIKGILKMKGNNTEYSAMFLTKD